MIFYHREIGSRLIGLSQRQDVSVWHMHVMPAEGCSIVKCDASGRIVGRSFQTWGPKQKTGLRFVNGSIALSTEETKNKIVPRKRFPVKYLTNDRMITPHAQLYMKPRSHTSTVLQENPQPLLWREVRCGVELLV